MRMRVGSSLAVGALVLALAAPASGQQAPTLGAPPTTDAPVQTTPVTTSAGDGGLKTWQEALIFAAGLVLLTGIAIAILADARTRAGRLRGGAVTEPGATPHQHKQQSKERARAKAKAARAQRRRNR